MSSICFSLNSEDPGFIVVTGRTDFLMPEIINPKETIEYKNLGGFEAEHALYVFAMDISYKFSCENFVNKFKNTREFTKAYYQNKILCKNKWFKNNFDKMLLGEPKLFFKKYLETLETDLLSYDQQSSEDLVKKSLFEINKLKPFLI